MERPAYDTAAEREYLARGWWAEGDTLPAWLARHARERPDGPAIASASGNLSWRELEQRVLRAAAGMKRRGVGHGDVVAVQLPNVPEFLIAHLAANRLGAVFCTVHMPYRGAEIETILSHSGAKLFLQGKIDIEDPDPLPADHPM